MHTSITESTSKHIIFVYKRDELFDDICHLSAFMAKNAVTKEGVPLLDNLAVSKDEEPMFLLCLRDALPDIWEIMLKLTHGIDEAYDDDEEFETEATETPTTQESTATTVAVGGLTLETETPYVTFRIVDNGAYNSNTLKVVDSSIRSSLEQAILVKWYSRISQTDMLQMAERGFSAEAASLARRLMQLFRKSVYPPATSGS